MEGLIHLDSLSLIIIFASIFLGSIIFSFSSRYLSKDKQKSWNIHLIVVIIASIFLAIADNIFLILLSYFIIKLPIMLCCRRARYIHIISTILLAIALLILYTQTGEGAISKILRADVGSCFRTIASCFILVSAMIQCGIFPFHKWLLSLLSVSTPMIAFINGYIVAIGIFIIARFSEIFTKSYVVLIIGIMAAFIGMICMFMQSDVKSRLSFSTIANMGFATALCGIGGFYLAVVFALLHGVFKTYLFLSSSTLSEFSTSNALVMKKSPKWVMYLYVKMLNFSQPPLNNYSRKDDGK
ncbi:MAG: hypothetical protein KA998_05290 [Rickettsiaceae bacterium]|nr:hypothetical protein [Rickettsiaceae bacterium]